MIIKKSVLALGATIVLLSGCQSNSGKTGNDWDQIAVPVELESNQQWLLIPSFSDNFNYSDKMGEFSQNWQDIYIDPWKGPGLTEWNTKNSSLDNGSLVISASRKTGTEKVHAGIVTSKSEVSFPVFIEANIKVANQVLSSNIWLLSKDTKRELDILEIYGSDRPDHEYFATHASNNYHVFLRDPESNEILKDFRKQFKKKQDNGAPYRLDFHRYGAYWKDAWNVDFYIDGKLVRSLTKNDIEDPEQFGFDRPMHIILDLEDHDWRSNQGHIATDDELADASKNKMYVDWIRVYQPVTAD